jgi:trehalose 6-phosphate synthase
LHDLVHQPVIDRSWWDAYRKTNELFAATARSFERPGRQPPLLWVHDYHLMLLPRMLRRDGTRSRILHFLHTPFPGPELFARLPWRADLLHGVLGADAVAFHTNLYRENFLRACRNLLPQVSIEGVAVRLPDAARYTRGSTRSRWT